MTTVGVNSFLLSYGVENRTVYIEYDITYVRTSSVQRHISDQGQLL